MVAIFFVNYEWPNSDATVVQVNIQQPLGALTGKDYG
jgi:hypothetical protein